MTDNSWPEVSTPGTIDPYGNPAPALPADAPGSSSAAGSSSTKDVAMEEASNVASQASTAAKSVAQTAKDEAVHVASEAKTSAQGLLSQAGSELSSQAGTQQQKAAEGIRTISSQLQTMADAPDQQGLASDLIRQAAGHTSTVASWLENKEPGDVLREVQTFARNRPGTFLLLAAGAGVLAGRLTRNLSGGSAGSQTASQASPSQARPSTQDAGPVQQETVFAAGTGADYYDEPVVGTGAPASTASLPSGAAVDTPLRLDDDPYRSGEGRQL